MLSLFRSKEWEGGKRREILVGALYIGWIKHIDLVFFLDQWHQVNKQYCY